MKRGFAPQGAKPLKCMVRAEAGRGSRSPDSARGTPYLRFEADFLRAFVRFARFVDFLAVDFLALAFFLVFMVFVAFAG